MTLTALDFPASPTVGDLYPDPPVTGQPTYRWDGSSWLAFRAAPLDTTVPYAPFAAMAYSGMQINGSIDVSQEKGYTPTTTSGYICDGWIQSLAGTMVLQGLVQPGNPTLFSGIPNHLQINVTTAQASLGAGDRAEIRQYIEGSRIARLAWGSASARPVTLGFWTAHHRAGTYSVALRNSATNRSYVTTYTQNVADSAEYKTVTIPGCPDGTWTRDETIGLIISFTLASGTTSTAPTANSWQTGSYVAASGQVNGVAATSDIFRITGIVVLPGTEAPSASQSPLIMRPYDQELITCRRYWQEISGGFRFDFYAITTLGFSLTYQRMRASPIATGSWATATNIANGPFFNPQPSMLTVTANVTAAGMVSGILTQINLDARL